jgi:FAD/FMN-containing dehydrogenase
MGKGGRIPARQTGSDAPHAIRLRIGDRQVSTSTEDIEAARHELTPMPDNLVRVFSRKPEAVVRPETAQEAADALGICFEERTRVVPRGAAS